MTDPRRALARTAIYRLFAVLIGAQAGRGRLVREFIQPAPGDKVLDIGCGPADIVGDLPAVRYFGFDASPDYIDSARSRWGLRGAFTCAAVNETTLTERNFDIVIAIGIIHHLDDDEARRLFTMAWDVLKPGGRLVTLDGVYVAKQSPLKRFILSRDRGLYIRDEAGYLALTAPAFSNVRPTIVHDLLTLPYTHLVMECMRT